MKVKIISTNRDQVGLGRCLTRRLRDNVLPVSAEVDSGKRTPLSAPVDTRGMNEVLRDIMTNATMALNVSKIHEWRHADRQIVQ